MTYSYLSYQQPLLLLVSNISNSSDVLKCSLAIDVLNSGIDLDIASDIIADISSFDLQLLIVNLQHENWIVAIF